MAATDPAEPEPTEQGSEALCSGVTVRGTVILIRDKNMLLWRVFA